MQNVPAGRVSVGITLFFDIITKMVDGSREFKVIDTIVHNEMLYNLVFMLER